MIMKRVLVFMAGLTMMLFCSCSRSPGIGNNELTGIVSREVPLNYQPEGMSLGDTWFLLIGDTTHVFYGQSLKPGSTRSRIDNGSIGHAVSKDLIHWRELPVAVRCCDPKAKVPYDRGEALFTGSAVENNGIIYNFYCGNDDGNADGSDRTDKPVWRQSINLTTSTDGINFVKYSEPTD